MRVREEAGSLMDADADAAASVGVPEVLRAEGLSRGLFLPAKCSPGATVDSWRAGEALL